MTPKLKLALVIGVAVALVGLIIIDQPNIGSKLSNDVDEKEDFALIKPTGEANALVEDLLNEAQAEKSVLDQEDSDATLLDGDLEEINQLGDAYDENDF